MTAPARPTPAQATPPAGSAAVRINPWLRRHHPAPPAPVRLVYFPHAGSSASACLRLSAALPPDAELVAVQYPGRQDRFSEPAIDTIDPLVRAVHRSLADLDDGRPLAFFGHSMGAVVAYEVARLRADEGAGPVRLIVSGRRAPHVVRDDHVHKGGDAALIAQLRRLSGTDNALLEDEGVLELILPALRADYHAIETYTWTAGAPLTCPITAVIGDADPRVDERTAREWRRHTTGAFDLHVLPGGHFYLGDGAIGVAGLVREILRGT